MIVNKVSPFFDIADPAFSVTSAEVRRAREDGWYARTVEALRPRFGDLAGELADSIPPRSAPYCLYRR
jgi:hypothetical protein